jgi:biopolymer transport protein ExbD
MRKFIQICSVLSLLVAFTVVASAKTEQGFGTEINIPFAFNVGDRAYEAGTYIIKIDRVSSATSTLSIQDIKSDDLHTVIVNVNNESASGDVRLVFDTIDGKKYLTKVRSQDKTFALFKPKSEKEAS